MSERIHVLAQQLFGKSSVEACDLQEIKDLVRNYPYFAPAQFLLLEKLKQLQAPEYTSQLQKSVLYYHNPLEFEYFISSDRFYSGSDGQTEDGTPGFHSDEEEELVPDILPDELNETVLEEIENEVEDEVIYSGARSWGVDPPEASIQEKDATEEPLNLLEKKLQQIKQQPFDESRLAENPNLIALKSQLSQVKSSDDLTFEPFHTVDYFASQGIKLSQEETGKDKFGQQLKSFTEWLKAMKRLPTPQSKSQPESSTEKKVQHLAEDSVHEADVVTEAMAEVWLKQGNAQKAIEVYNKLSLLNPSKRAYFAAKIDHLKSS